MVESSRLNYQFDVLGMNAQFIAKAKKLGLKTLADVMEADLRKLKMHKEFSYLWYAELLDLLEKQGLLRDFQRRQL